MPYTAVRSPLKDGDKSIGLGTPWSAKVVAGYATDLYAQGWIYSQNALSAYYIRDGIKLELIKEAPVWVLPPETHKRAHRGRDATGIDHADPGAEKGQPKETDSAAKETTCTDSAAKETTNSVS